MIRKETDEKLHEKFTGISNELIYENLLKLDKAGAETVLRCPVIPNYNDREDHYIGIGELADKLTNIVEINILPYHNLGSAKSRTIGCAYQPASLPHLSEQEKVNRAKTIRSKTDRKLIWDCFIRDWFHWGLGLF